MSWRRPPVADHDQLLRDYLAAALVALEDLDDTLRAYLDEGPGVYERMHVDSARSGLGDARYYLTQAQRRQAVQACLSPIIQDDPGPVTPSSYSVQRRQAVKAGLSAESVTRRPPLPLICPDCGCIWPGLDPATAPGGDPVRCSCGRLLYGQTIRLWPDDPEEERRHGPTVERGET